jgi:hypothetical protein
MYEVVSSTETSIGMGMRRTQGPRKEGRCKFDSLKPNPWVFPKVLMSIVSNLRTH